jgi:hypothetical protein
LAIGTYGGSPKGGHSTGRTIHGIGINRASTTTENAIASTRGTREIGGEVNFAIGVDAGGLKCERLKLTRNVTGDSRDQAIMGQIDDVAEGRVEVRSKSDFALGIDRRIAETKNWPRGIGDVCKRVRRASPSGGQGETTYDSYESNASNVTHDLTFHIYRNLNRLLALRLQ